MNIKKIAIVSGLALALYGCDDRIKNVAYLGIEAPTGDKENVQRYDFNDWGDVYNLGNNSYTISVAVGDLDGDGDLDIIIANGNKAKITILKNRMPQKSKDNLENKVK